ncbi:MAG: hypothetical protein GY731_16390, partial [Gammaproteobacteria bacterium]|nr:hypothetical protein [Gammaproteobacteria bacterium]
TLFLAVAGFISGTWMHESKGARTFVILALGAIPANFAILGALIYSQGSWDTAAAAYPAFVTWRVEHLSSALITAAGSLLVLIPVVWLGFLVLARRSAPAFTALYLVSNAAMLIPLRETLAVACLFAGLSVVVWWLVTRSTRQDMSLRTLEGILARALHLLPLVVILGRSLWLHSGDTLLLTAASLMVFILLRQISTQLNPKSLPRRALELVSLIPAVTTAATLSAVFMDISFNLYPWVVPVFALSSAGLIFELSLRASGGGSGYRRLSAALVTIGLLLNLMWFGGLLTSSLCLIVGLVVLIYGHSIEQRLIFALGSLNLLVGITFQASYTAEFFNLAGWGSLALLGITAIIASSLVERHGARLKEYLSNWHHQFRSWEY